MSFVVAGWPTTKKPFKKWSFWRNSYYLKSDPEKILMNEIPQTARTRSWGPSGFLRGVKLLAADALDGASSPSFAPKAHLR